MTVVLLCLGLVIGILAHECGHALLASQLGFHPRLVSIGMGPILYRRQIGKVSFILRSVPLNRFVSTLPRIQPRRTAWSAVLLGGVIGNLAVILVVCAAGAAKLGNINTLGPIIAAQFYLIFLALLPLPSTINGIRHDTDGLQLLRLLVRRPKDTVTEVYRSIFSAMTPEGEILPPPSEDTPEILYQLSCRERYQYTWAWRNSSASLLTLLQRNHLSAPERAFVESLVVSAELALGGLDVSLSDLDKWSLNAISYFPTPDRHIIRCGVLIAKGSAEVARSELELLLGEPLAPDFKVACLAFLGQAEAAMGDISASQRWIAKARTAASGATGLSQEILLSIIDHLQRSPLSVRYLHAAP